KHLTPVYTIGNRIRSSAQRLAPDRAVPGLSAHAALSTLQTSIATAHATSSRWSDSRLRASRPERLASVASQASTSRPPTALAAEALPDDNTAANDTTVNAAIPAARSLNIRAASATATAAPTAAIGQRPASRPKQ